MRLPRTEVAADAELTYAPSARLKRARTGWELLRGIAVWLTTAVAVGVGIGLAGLAHLAGGASAAVGGWWLAVLLGGAVLMAAGAVAAASSVIAKKVFVGRIEVGEHPLWSSFVWRNEVADTFTELVTAPWFARAAAGTPAMVWWLRAMGAKIGHGAWVEAYWFPEADLISVGDGGTVNRGCVVQTHLFHDRVMALDTVEIGAGATLGPNSVVLPAGGIGDGATVGAGSLVMRGERLPAGTRWLGNPVTPWRDPVPVVGSTTTAAEVAEQPAAAEDTAADGQHTVQGGDVVVPRLPAGAPLPRRAAGPGDEPAVPVPDAEVMQAADEADRETMRP